MVLYNGELVDVGVGEEVGEGKDGVVMDGGMVEEGEEKEGMKEEEDMLRNEADTSEV